MKKAVVLGASGFIGHHMARYLKEKGYRVTGVDKRPQIYPSYVDEFYQYDLTVPTNCDMAISGMDEVYQFAAEMGGMGFISTEHIASLHDSNLINTYIAQAVGKYKPQRFFYSSSVCVYPVSRLDAGEEMREDDVLPADPNQAYGWEKLIAEIRYQAYAEKYGLNVRIARFDNTYGPECSYMGGREKAPAALCRKVSQAIDGDEIEVWGSGNATRHFIYIDDLLEGIYRLTQSDYSKPLNLGSDELVTINELAQNIIDISGKTLQIKNIEGPVGAVSRRINHDKAKEILGWEASTSLKEGLRKLYEWIDKQNG